MVKRRREDIQMLDLKLTDKQLSRFMAKVEKLEGDGCWLWTGSLDTKGYSQLRVNNMRLRGHRVAYVQFVEPIPDGMLVCHHCDVPRCVRPDHLFLGTNSDNMQDMLAKGRANYAEQVGGANRNARLNDEMVREIIALFPTHNNKQIAALYGVSHGAVSLIRRGKSWTHIERDVAKPYASLRR